MTWLILTKGNRIYVGDKSQHNKYISCGHHGFREEDILKVFHIISLCEHIYLIPGMWVLVRQDLGRGHSKLKLNEKGVVIYPTAQKIN